MRSHYLVFTVLLVIGVVQGQSVKMPIPGYSYTYSYASAARGFYFQSPITFGVSGLRVPDEKNFGKQNVAVYALASKPVNYIPKKSELLFYSTGTPANQIIPCNITIKAQQWFCVVGMCGDASISHNSYGMGGFISNIAGGPKVTLNRLALNSNLVSSGGLGSLAAYSSSYIGRVEVYVQTQGFAKAEDYGLGSTSVPVSGKVPLPMAPFNRTYSAPYTYGYYFRTPCPLSVTAWQVPDEGNNGKMNVAIYRLKTAPPMYPSTTSVTPLYFKSGVNSGTPYTIAKPLAFNTGDFLCVLGACGPDTNNYLLSSYSTNGPFPVRVGGQNANLSYLLMRSSILNSNGAGAISGHSTATGQGRIQLYLTQYVVPTLTTVNQPVIGNKVLLRMAANIPDGLAGGVFMGVGRQNVSLPLGTLLVNAPILGIYPLPGGTGNLELPIPNDPALVGGGPLNLQGFVLAIGNFGLTNGVEWYLGK